MTNTQIYLMSVRRFRSVFAKQSTREKIKTIVTYEVRCPHISAGHHIPLEISK